MAHRSIRACAGENLNRAFVRAGPGSTITCFLDCGARTFAYSVDGGAPVATFEGLPGRLLYPAVCVRAECEHVRLMEYYSVPHVRCIVRIRVLCQADRARAVADAGRGEVAAWLCERAPLWVVVHVCALLRCE